jgi:hypothetical protein
MVFGTPAKSNFEFKKPNISMFTMKIMLELSSSHWYTDLENQFSNSNKFMELEKQVNIIQILLL